MTFRPHLASDEKVWQVFKALNDIKLQSLPVSPSLKDRVDYLTDLMLGIQVLEQNKEVIQSIQKKQESFWGWTQSWVTREQVLVNDFNSLETHLDRCLSEIEHSDNQEPFEHLFKDEFLKIERFSELSPKERLELYHFLDKMDILSKTSTVQKKCPSLKRIIQVKKEQIHVLLSINLQNWEAHFSRILENRQEDHEVICHLQSALNSFKKEFSDLKIGPLDKTTKDIIKNIEKIIEKFPKAKDLTSNKTIFSDPQKIHSEWLEFEHAMGLSEQGDPEQLTPHQQLIQYYYETGRLLLAKHHLKNTPHPTLATLIDEKLAKINDWEKLPLDTFVYTNTYQPSHESLLYPENIKHVVCLKTLDSTIFDTLTNVEAVILIDTDEKALEPFIKDKLHTLKNLKSFTLNSKRNLSLSKRNQLIEALKQCSSLESLKIASRTELTIDARRNFRYENLRPMDLPTIDLTFFPHLKTLHVNQPTVISNFHKSSLIDLSMVVIPACKSSYDELIKPSHLKNLESLSLSFIQSSINRLDCSALKNIKTLKISSDKYCRILISKTLRKLEHLDVDLVIPSGTFEHYLDIGYYDTHRIDFSFFPNIKTLSFVSKGENRLVIQNFESLAHLQDLYLENVILGKGIIRRTILMPPSLNKLKLFDVDCPWYLDISHCRNLQYIDYVTSELEGERSSSHSCIKGFSSCENLTHLSIKRCKKLLSNHAFKNELRELPQKLIHLDLTSNRLDHVSFIPFPKLTNLRSLNLRDNTIHTLPDELAQLPSSCTVDLERNGIPNLILANFNSVISRVQSENPRLGPNVHKPIHESQYYLSDLEKSLLSLGKELKRTKEGFPYDDSLKNSLLFWDKKIIETNLEGCYQKSYIEFVHNIDAYLSSKNDQAILAKFLNRLTGIKNYQTPSTRKIVIKRVYDLLTLMAQKEDVRTAVLAIIKEVLESCHDRVSTAFDELEILVALHDDKKTPQEKAKLVIGLHRYKLFQEKINEASTKKLKGVENEIELFLYAQLRLTEKLEMPISAKKSLSYFSVMKEMVDTHIDDIGNDILQQTSSLDHCCQILRNHISWDEYLKKQYSPQFKEISNTIDKKQIDPKTLTSDKYEEECQKLKELHEERNEELLNRLTRQILSQFLSSSSS
ncbi:MAG: NEL-type E3 ubiquitin ligase domain-containing protein [Rhabdochlamydiaceae bacterium]